MKIFRFQIITFLCALALALYGCANIVPPEGGKKDETAPVLLSISPADSSLEIRPSRITLRFNEYIDVRDLEKEMQLSPLLPVTPTVTSYGKRVEIKIQDTQLQANTTYLIRLGDALRDNHEGNPYPDFTYMFSTGSYFDSLMLQGRLVNALTGAPDSGMLVTLYEAGENDTSVFRKKPVYATRANATGEFSFRALPPRPFRMYAIQDANNNFIYDPEEEQVGFLDSLAIPGTDSLNSYTIRFFKEVADTGSFADSTAEIAGNRSEKQNERSSLRDRGTRKAKNDIGYQVMADTMNLDSRSFELTQPLMIRLTTLLGVLDSAKVYLSYENNGIEVEGIHRMEADTAAIRIRSEWQPDKIYTLRLVKGWAKDTAGNELPPGKYRFRTKGEEDYGKLSVRLHQPYQGDSFLLYIYKGDDSVYCRPVTDSVVTLQLLEPGDYGMRLIRDDNRNGRWDPGKLLQKIQPEEVIPYTSKVVVKAGWDNEVDFVPATGKQGRKSRLEERRDSGIPAKPPAPPVPDKE